MAENSEKELDAFIKKSVKQAGLEEPSLNFTTAVLSRLESQKSPSVTSYKPLISWQSWTVIIAIFSGLGVLILFGWIDTGISWPELLNDRLGALSRPEFLDKITNIGLSNTVVYSVLGLAILFYAQIWLLKNHVDKKYAI